MDIVKFDEVESKVLELRGQKVILGSNVAALYGLETKRINEAVKNNPDKFPEVISLNSQRQNRRL
jgi:ORF6N domain